MAEPQEAELSYAGLGKQPVEFPKPHQTHLKRDELVCSGLKDRKHCLCFEKNNRSGQE